MSSSSGSSRLVQNVFIRREGRLLGEWPTRLLISGIQNGKLKPSDEFSGDGRHWTALGRHHQLARYFQDQSPKSASGLERELGDLADLLKEINQA